MAPSTSANVQPRIVAYAARHRIALAVLGALLGALVVFAAVVDWNWRRGPVQRYVGARTGMSLTLGNLHVDVFRGLHTVVRGVRFGINSDADAALLNAREIEVRIAPAALLRGELIAISR